MLHTNGHKIHPPIKGLLLPLGIEPSPFRNAASKITELQMHATTSITLRCIVLSTCCSWPINLQIKLRDFVLASKPNNQTVFLCNSLEIIAHCIRWSFHWLIGKFVFRKKRFTKRWDIITNKFVFKIQCLRLCSKFCLESSEGRMKQCPKNALWNYKKTTVHFK